MSEAPLSKSNRRPRLDEPSPFSNNLPFALSLKTSFLERIVRLISFLTVGLLCFICPPMADRTFEDSRKGLCVDEAFLVNVLSPPSNKMRFLTGFLALRPCSLLACC